MKAMNFKFNSNTTSLKQKLLAVMFIIGFVSVSLIAFLGFTSGKNAVATLAESQLTMARDLRKEFLISYYANVANSVITLSQDTEVIRAMENFAFAFKKLPDESKANFDALKSENKKLLSDFMAKVNEDTGLNYNSNDFDTEDPSAIVLRNLYITNSPFSQGEKHKLNSASDGSTYSKFHAKFQPYMKLRIERYKYYDIFLINNSGEIVYTYFKELDYATNLNSPGMRETGIGILYQELKNSEDKSKILNSKFTLYAPSLGAPAQFMGTPIYNGNQRVGTLIIQISIEEINNALTGNRKWKELGLGDTGEIYIVGSDRLMRSDSRSVIENPSAFVQLLRDLNFDEAKIKRIEKFKSTILLMEVKSDSVLKALNNETGFQISKDYRGVEVLSAYTPVTVLSSKWAVIAEIDAEEAFASSKTLLRNIIIAGSVLILVIILFSYVFANSVIRPIRSFVEATREIANEVRNGKLDARMETKGIPVDFQDIPPGINGILEAMTAPVQEASNVIVEMEKGNLTQKVNGDYKGEHGDIKNALNNTLDSFNEILNGLAKAVDEMENGANQISDASQSLAQGATEQAASVEEISAAVTQLTSQTRSSAENAKKASDLSARTLDGSKKGREMMNELWTAMIQIKSGADNISKIIKAIDEIAFQTNLLSLNAAVEAARAGRHGKGFAVVAAEVKILSDRSAKAARETAEMIQESINRTAQGANLAEKTVAAFSEISDSVDNVAKLMREVATASEEQTLALAEVEKSVQQIEQVTQRNANSSEETASASTELAGQAESIGEMVGKFKLTQTFQKTSSHSIPKKVESFQPEKKQVHSQPERKPVQKEKPKAKPEIVISLEDDDFGKF